MPPDLHDNQALALKKRARRRLVGAIALVLLMVIILPRVLQDRAGLIPHEAINITMPAANANKPIEAIDIKGVTPEMKAASNQAHQEDLTLTDRPVVVASPDARIEPKVTETPVASEAATKTKVESSKVFSTEKNEVADKNAVESQLSIKLEKKTEPKLTEVKKIDEKVLEAKSVEVIKSPAKEPETNAQQKHDESFTIQVGVFSDIANVKQLQEKLKRAGFISQAEKISTPSGEKIRLKAGNFHSRQDATYALTKLKAADLTGMVISND